MTTSRKILAGMALALVTAWGCLDALAPRAPHHVQSVGIVPLFDGAAGADEIPGDVDLILVTIHNPPAPDTTVAVDVEPGQDSIVISFAVPLGSSSVDTVGLAFAAVHAPHDTLYTGTQSVAVRVGAPSHADSVRVRYVGPGQNIASIAITPTATALRPGDSLAFGFTALDSTGATIVGMPVFWAVRGGAGVGIGASGMAHARTEGATWVVVSSAARSSVQDSARIVVSTAPLALVALGPATATFTASAGGASPAAQAVAVTNGGAGALSAISLGQVAYVTGQPSGWLTATLSRSVAPATITLEPATGSLAPGTYTATVPVTSVLAANSPQTVAVTFTVAPVPLIGLGQSAVTIVDTVATSDPAPATVAVTNAGTGTLGGMAVGTIGYGAGGSGWLTASLSGATAPAMLTMSVAKGSLQPGVYTATVPLTSASVGALPRTVSVTYDLRPQAAIGLGAATLAFVDTMTTSDPLPRTVAVTNAGTGTLSALAVGTIDYGTGPTGWVTGTTLDTTVAPATLTVTVGKGALQPGTYTATVPVTSPGANNAPRTVTVTFTIAPMPLIGLGTPAVTITDTVLTGDPAPRTVAVTNAGTGTLGGLAVGTIGYGASQPTGWLAASLGGTAAPATLTLRATKGALAPGTYTASVPLTASLAGNAPAVTVTFTVMASPLASMRVLPGFFALKPADTLGLFVFGYDGAGTDVPPLGVRFASRDPAVVTADSATGKLTGVTAGATVIVATAPGASGPVRDSALIVVPASGQALVFAMGDGTAYAAPKVGDTLHVIVGIDLAEVSGEALGNYSAQLSWAPGVLQYLGSDAVPLDAFTAPTLGLAQVGSGVLGLSASNPTGASGPVLGLAYLKLLVTGTGASPLTLAFTNLTAAITGTNLLSAAQVFSGSVNVLH